MSDQSSFPNSQMSESMRRILESMPETPPPPVPPTPPTPSQPGEFRQFIVYIAELIALLFVVVGTVVPALLGLWLRSELATIVFACAGFLFSVLVSAGYLVLSDIAANTRETTKALREIAKQGIASASQQVTAAEK